MLRYVNSAILFRLKSIIWLRGQEVKTSPFHGGNTGSIPVGVINHEMRERTFNDASFLRKLAGM